MVSSGRFEVPAFDRLDCRPIEIRVTGRSLNQDLANPSIYEDQEPEQGGSLDPLSPRRFRISGLDLVAASRSGHAKLKSRHLGADIGHSEAEPALTGSSTAPSRPCPREDGHVALRKELSGPRFSSFCWCRRGDCLVAGHRNRPHHVARRIGRLRGGQWDDGSRLWLLCLYWGRGRRARRKLLG